MPSAKRANVAPFRVLAGAMEFEVIHMDKCDGCYCMAVAAMWEQMMLDVARGLAREGRADLKNEIICRMADIRRIASAEYGDCGETDG